MFWVPERNAHAEESCDGSVTWLNTHLDFWIEALERYAAVLQVFTGNETLLLDDQVPER